MIEVRGLTNGTASVLGMLLAVASAAAALGMAPNILELPLGEGADVVGTVGLVFAAGGGLAAGLGFVLRSTAGALIAVFLLMLLLPLVLPQFGYEWMDDLAAILPGTGAVFLLTGEQVAEGMTRASAILTMLAWTAGALFLGWARLVRDDANR